jgi:hypothetical protein
MAQDQSKYVLLKLRSGDEIIAKKSGSKKGILILSRPLHMQRSTFLDPLTGGVKKNLCVFRDWLEFTSNLECEIPEDFIIFNGDPTPDMVQRYITELDKLDNPDKYNAIKSKAPKTSKEETDELLDEYFKALMSPLPPTPKKDTPPEQKPPLTLPPSSSMVTASFSMPPDVFLNIVLNMPMFDGWGGEMGDDSSEGEDGGDDDSEADQSPPPPKNKPSNKKKPKRDDDTPPSGEWHGRFGFPK